MTVVSGNYFVIVTVKSFFRIKNETRNEDESKYRPAKFFILFITMKHSLCLINERIEESSYFLTN